MEKEELKEYYRFVAEENRIIVSNNKYYLNGKCVRMKSTLKEHQAVNVISPTNIKEIKTKVETREQSGICTGECRIRVIDSDSFHDPKMLVMNFANAKHPGGGYKNGAIAQEESLCRQSTLYASIGSNKAREMYRHNEYVNAAFDSEYMLISPCVEIFRNSDMSLKEDTLTTAVITLPAPNRRGRAVRKTEEELRKVFEDRIRNMLYCAAYYGYKTLTLGAWGCGAFGNDPEMVAEAFRKVLDDENLNRFFGEIDFAIPGKNSRNYKAFSSFFTS